MPIDTSQLPNKAPKYDLEEMLEAGCHFGHQIRRWHPQMKEWIYMQKSGVHIFDLAKTAQQLQHAYNYFYDLGQKGKTVVVLGTKRQAKDVVKKAAEENGVMYIVSRWLGGFMTNWSQISKSLNEMLKIEDGLKSGFFDQYTKFERVQMDKKRGRLERFFGGIRDLKKIPDVIFVVDPVREKNAVEEARTIGVPVIALADTDADPTLLDLIIPANDDSKRSIELIVTQVCEAYAAGKKASPKG